MDNKLSDIKVAERRVLRTHWVGNAWSYICDKKAMKWSFKKCGINVALDQGGQHTWKIWEYLELLFTPGKSIFVHFLPGNTWDFSVFLFEILLSLI